MRNNSSECYQPDMFKVLAVINMTTGFISALCSVIVLVILIGLQKHYFHTQRLIMYLHISVVIRGIISLIDFNAFLSTNDSPYCTFCGFMQSYVIFVQLIAILWIVLDLFLMSIYHFYAQWKFEVIQVLSTFFVPLLFVWIPIIPKLNLYGYNGAFCGIRNINYETCTVNNAGYLGYLLMRLLPLTVSLIAIIILYVVVLIKLKHESRQYQGIFDPNHRIETEQFIKASILQIYPLIYFFFNIFPVIYASVMFFKPGNAHPYFGVLAILGWNLQGVAIAMAYALDKKTLSRVKMSCMKLCLSNQTKHSVMITSYQSSFLYASHGDSLKGTISIKD